jgi:hypothetical protein
MPGISTTYLLPAIVLNPALILHIINTIFSHFIPPPPTISFSPHATMERLGPLPGSPPYLDMHTNDQLCWSYTAIMVVAQVFAFGKVSDNRIARKAMREKKERLRKEQLESLMLDERLVKANGYHGSGTDGAMELPIHEHDVAKSNGNINGQAVNGSASIRKCQSDVDESMTETSEEEMMI